MKRLLKYLGILIILIGAVILIISTVSEISSNTTLAIGGAAIVLGILAQVVIGRYVE